MTKMRIFVVIFFLFANIAHSQYARKISVAILPFDFSGSFSGKNVSWTKVGVPDQISTAFHKYYRNRIRLVERSRLNDLLQEQQLSQAGFVDTDQMVEVGKYLSANFSLMGNIICADASHLMITVKIVDIETSEYVSVNYMTDLEQGIFTIGDSLVVKIYPEMLRLNQKHFMSSGGEMVEKIPPASTAQPVPDLAGEAVSNKNIHLISAVSKAATSHFYNAVDWIRQQNWERALLELNRSVELDSGFARAYANLGTVYMNLGDFDRARQALLKCLDIYPESYLAYYNLGSLETYCNNFPSALVYFKKGLRFNPDDLELMTEVGKVYIKLDSLRQADKIFEDILWTDSSFVEAEYYLGITAAMRKDIVAAEKHLKRAIQTKEPYFQPIRRLANMRLGALYEEIYKKPAEAIHYYEQALLQEKSRIESSDVKLLLLPLSRLYIKTNQPIKACDLLMQVLDYDSSNLKARYYYALALWNSEQKDQAIIELQTITRTAPPGPILERAKQMLRDIRGY